MAVRICPKCGGKVALSREDCPHCGYDFEEEKIKCPECEEEVIPIDGECPVCGHYFDEEDSSEADDGWLKDSEGLEIDENGCLLGRGNCTDSEIRIPEGVTSIHDHAFEDCEDLTSVHVPHGVTTIGAFAFSGCRNLSSVSLPTDLEEIGDNAFDHVQLVLNINYSGSLEEWNSIKKGSFWNGHAPSHTNINILLILDDD